VHVAVLAAAFGVGAGPALALGIGGFALSVVAGGVSFVLPQGLGAREVALGLVLTTLLTGPALVTVVALSRVVVTAGEALGMAVGFAVLSAAPGRGDGRSYPAAGRGSGGRNERLVTRRPTAGEEERW